MLHTTRYLWNFLNFDEIFRIDVVCLIFVVRRILLHVKHSLCQVDNTAGLSDSVIVHNVCFEHRREVICALKLGGRPNVLRRVYQERLFNTSARYYALRNCSLIWNQHRCLLIFQQGSRAIVRRSLLCFYLRISLIWQIVLCIIDRSSAATSLIFLDGRSRSHAAQA